MTPNATNDNAAIFNWRVVQGIPLRQYFDLQEDGQPMDCTGIQVYMPMINAVGVSVAVLTLDEGFVFMEPNRLIASVGTGTFDLPAGGYTTFIQILIPGKDPFILCKGIYESIKPQK